MSEPPAPQNNAITRNRMSGVLSFPRKRESRSRKGGWMRRSRAQARISIGPFGSRKGICEIARNEKAVKPLKINNSAKS